MRWPVIFAFVVAWNGPLLFHLLRSGFNLPERIFFHIVAIQIAVLVIVCLLAAGSATVHRIVFRPGIAPFQFRRHLIIAACYLLACLALWGIARA